MDQQNLEQISEFEQALQQNLDAKILKAGAVVDGTIVAIHGDVALVDVGGKSEAVLPREELDELGTGDPVEVVVVESGEEIRVSRRLALERKLKEELARAVEEGSPVEGKVVGRRKGGFDITIAGVRGFCPVSQISDRRTEDLDQFLGQSYPFKVLEYSPDDRKLVVSRAALLREEKAKRREETLSHLEPGAVVDGVVRSLTDFGAFVDLGGVDGLVHVTEISRRRVGNPREVLEVGQEVRVKVLEIDFERNRISLSIKQLEADPWEGAEERYTQGAAFEGRIVRKADFGLFVELEPGIDGLLHVSQLPPGMETTDPELEVGETVTGWIRDFDGEHRRIGLSLRPIPSGDPWQRIEMHYQPGQVVKGVVENGASFGVFVELEPGLSGLVPVSELGMGRDVDPKTALKPGTIVHAKVMTVDSERKRISLSIRAFKQDQERSEYSGHMSSQPSEAPTTTVFGERLLKALGKRPE
ncbi:MAG: S1 RNA-binding domain-containing protein [Acidobacteria bacterium]|nr:S1 RNA-binding domain-containing protein [Acidobacteriota bacterium]